MSMSARALPASVQISTVGQGKCREAWRRELSELRIKLEEWAFVFEASGRTQVCLVLAVLSPLMFLWAGDYFTGRIEFAPPFEAMLGPVREAVFHRYGEAAIMAFLGFMGAAVKNFRKTRRRLFEGR